TLVPGLWDCHMHVDNDYTGPSELSLGVTSLRDPGNKDDLTLDRRARWQAGKLLFPRVHASSLIDGKSPRAAQFATVVTSREEALAAVDAAARRGLDAIKLYGSLDPAWVAPMAAQAHRSGLHVHGHVPAGMRPLDAIDAGYDEITHINFVAMQAMPDSVVADSNGIQRLVGIGRFMKDVDLGSDAIKAIVDAMARRKIVLDPTLSVFEGLLVTTNGDVAPAYAPFVGTLPPAVERGFRQGGFEPPEGVSRADFRASFRRLQELLAVLHKAGVPIVAGTDGSGIELVRELELYVEAGMTSGQALAAATIVPARLLKADAQTGSIAVGKLADLVLVDGDPSTRIGDLRHTRLVMTQGYLMQAGKLRAAVGVTARPAFALAD
ncbi:MAG: amidohydrolase family protein, partial [Caldimonas sp.]